MCWTFSSGITATAQGVGKATWRGASPNSQGMCEKAIGVHVTKKKQYMDIAYIFKTNFLDIRRYLAIYEKVSPSYLEGVC